MQSPAPERQQFSTTVSETHLLALDKLTKYVLVVLPPYSLFYAKNYLYVPVTCTLHLLF
jgi:hypothetical protein